MAVEETIDSSVASSNAESCRSSLQSSVPTNILAPHCVTAICARAVLVGEVGPRNQVGISSYLTPR